MNVLKALKVAELRKKLSIIPAKLIIALVFTIAINWDTNIETVWNNAKASPKKYLVIFFIVYGAISYVYFFIRLMHNWIFGIIISVGVAVLVYTQVGKLGQQPLMIAFAVMLIGGPVMDLINLLRYKSMKNDVIRAEEERGEAYYDDGYEDGYRKGIREGKRDVRRVRREYEDRLDESLRQSRIEGRRDRDRYLEYDEYDEERNYDDEYYGGRYRDDRAYDNREYDDREYDDAEYDEYEDGYYEDETDEEYVDDRGYDRLNDSYYNDRNYDSSGNSRSRIQGDRYSEERDRMRSREYTQGDSSNAVGFFADCKTPSAIKRRYHDLCKVYHPDSGNGSSEIFYAIKQEYDRLSQ